MSVETPSVGGGESNEPSFFDSIDDAMSSSSVAEEVADSDDGDDDQPDVADVPEAAEDDDADGATTEEPEPEPEPKEKAEDEEKKDASKPFLKIKANGEEHELSEEQAKVLAQKGLAADEKFKEAAQIRKQTEALIKQLKEDPIAVLQHPHVGLDFRKIAEEYLYEIYEFEAKPELERKAIEAERRLAKYEAEEKARKEREEQAKIENATKFYVEKFRREIDAELDASGIADRMWATQRAVHYLKEALGKGVKATAKDVMQFVQQDYQEFRTRSVENMTPEQILAFLGEEKIAKVKKYQLDQRKKMVPPSVKPSSAGSIGRKSSKGFQGYQSSTNEIFG